MVAIIIASSLTIFAIPSSHRTRSFPLPDKPRSIVVSTSSSLPVFSVRCAVPSSSQYRPHDQLLILFLRLVIVDIRNKPFLCWQVIYVLLGRTTLTDFSKSPSGVKSTPVLVCAWIEVGGTTSYHPYDIVQQIRTSVIG